VRLPNGDADTAQGLEPAPPARDRRHELGIRRALPRDAQVHEAVAVKLAKVEERDRATAAGVESKPRDLDLVLQAAVRHETAEDDVHSGRRGASAGVEDLDSLKMLEPLENERDEPSSTVFQFGDVSNKPSNGRVLFRRTDNFPNLVARPRFHVEVQLRGFVVPNLVRCPRRFRSFGKRT
jgi:hypothetical protein